MASLGFLLMISSTYNHKWARVVEYSRIVE
jgi:hypothetical protein